MRQMGGMMSQLKNLVNQSNKAQEWAALEKEMGEMTVPVEEAP
jgi:hypothetical protein